MQVMKYIKDRAMMSIETIIGMALALLVMIAILPNVLGTFFNASTSGWDATTKTIWGLLPIVIVVVVILAVYKGRR